MVRFPFYEWDSRTARDSWERPARMCKSWESKQRWTPRPFPLSAIQCEMWKAKKFETLFPHPYDVFCYDEMGKVYCSCPSEKRGEDELRELAFVGFEKDRGTLKYRCPAAAFDFDCPGRNNCEELSPVGVGDFGRVIRVSLALVVMLAMALGRIRAGQSDKMRSLIAPVVRAA